MDDADGGGPRPQDLMPVPTFTWNCSLTDILARGGDGQLTPDAQVGLERLQRRAGDVMAISYKMALGETSYLEYHTERVLGGGAEGAASLQALERLTFPSVRRLGDAMFRATSTSGTHNQPFDWDGAAGRRAARDIPGIEASLEAGGFDQIPQGQLRSRNAISAPLQECSEKLKHAAVAHVPRAVRQQLPLFFADQLSAALGEQRGHVQPSIGPDISEGLPGPRIKKRGVIAALGRGLASIVLDPTLKTDLMHRAAARRDAARDAFRTLVRQELHRPQISGTLARPPDRCSLSEEQEDWVGGFGFDP